MGTAITGTFTDHARGAQHVGLCQQAVNPGDPDVGQPLDGVLERSRTDGSLFGHRQITRAGRADEDRTPARGRRLRIGREIRRAAELVDEGARKSGRERLRLGGVGARREKTAARSFKPFRDRYHLADRLARTKNHLLMPLGDGPEVIDRCERQRLELQAADLADPYR